MAANPAAGELKELRDKVQRRRTAAGYAIWGTLAVGAVFIAALTVALAVNAHRSGRPLQAKAPTPIEIQRKQSAVEIELSRVHDALRALSAERDRLTQRVDELERSIGTITASLSTGSIDRTQSDMFKPEITIQTPTAAELSANAAALATQASRTREPDRDSAPVRPAPDSGAIRAPADAPAAQPDPPTVIRTQFAVELGGEASVGALRKMWDGLRSSHGQALEGLQPLVSVRDGKKPGTVELRLVAGPLANAAAAARLCANLQGRGVGCQTAVFEGQRLALR